MYLIYMGNIPIELPSVSANGASAPPPSPPHPRVWSLPPRFVVSPRFVPPGTVVMRLH
jgi:hypothetical protein